MKENTQLTKKVSHFYLYAKHHYKETDILEDLKKIYDHWIGHDYGNVEDALTKLKYIAFEQLDSYDSFHRKEFIFSEFMQILRDTDFFGKPKDLPWNVRCAQAYFHILRWTDVEDLPFKIVEASETVLPFSEVHKKNLAEKEAGN